MENRHSIKELWRENWLCLLIAAQPLMDFLAYWTRSPEGTAAGYIRLAIMLALPLGLLISLREKKRFVISMLVIGLFCALHFLNSWRMGFINARFDLSYMARTAQLPILALCLCYYIRDERTKAQAMRGLLAAALIMLSSVALAYLTGTWNSTYGAGLGISGWVIDDNRCANSVILVTLTGFLLYCALRSERRLVNYAVPPLCAFALILNGTKACYYSIFAMYLGFACFMLLQRLICKKALRKRLVIVLLLVAIISAAVYPITPRCKISQSQAQGRKEVEDEITLILQSLGYDLKAMTTEKKLGDPVVMQVFGDYYYDVMWSIIPDMFDRFSYEQILLKYDFTTSAAKLIDTRLMKRSYASLIWDEYDAPTHLVGYEVSDVWFNGGIDVENDWPALFFYYGYIGLGLYGLFALYFVWLIIRRLARDFKGTLTLENFTLLLLFALNMGLAQFSGAVLRRPNVSVYTAVIMALIYYKTAVAGPETEPAGGRLEA